MLVEEGWAVCGVGVVPRHSPPVLSCVGMERCGALCGRVVVAHIATVGRVVANLLDAGWVCEVLDGVYVVRLQDGC